MGQCAHLSNYVTLKDCEVVALAELKEATGKRVAQRYGIPRVFSDAATMLAEEKLDAVVASQPFARHGILLTQLAESGVPLFSEKPIAASIEVGKRIVDALKKNNTYLMVGYHKRSDPATMYAKERIDRFKASGELGRLRYVRIVMPAGDWVAGGRRIMLSVNEKAPDLDWDPKPSDMDEEGFKAYTTFVNFYIHQVNLMRHLLGESYHVTHADPSGVLLVAKSDSGVPGVVEMSPYRTTIDWQESALVGFERGYVKLELPAPLAANRPGRVEILRDPGGECVPEVSTPHLPWVSAMHQQAVHFVKTVKGEIEPPCDAEEALEDLRVARQYLKLWKGV
jgi:predicted dehydrogenase